MFYGWQKQLMENLAVAVEAISGRGRRAESKDRELTKKVAKLEEKLQRKEHVIAEISEEYVAL